MIDPHVVHGGASSWFRTVDISEADGDACDSDLDSDGIRNELDNCPLAPNLALALDLQAL